MKKDKETWKDVKGYEGKYQISNLGRVKSFHGKKERILKHANTFGYDFVGLYKNGNMVAFKIHRLVAEHFVENANPNEFKVVNHIDENKTNNHFKNLEWCTGSKNVSYSSHKRKIRVDNSSGNTGVAWNERRKSWSARLILEGESKINRYFKNKQDAIDAIKEIKINYLKERRA